MAAIRNGDEEAFEHLMGRHVDALFRYALRLSGSPVLADDLTQETWLTVWEKTHRYKPKKAKLRTWLYSVLHNKFIDTIRKNRFDELPPEETGSELVETAARERAEEILVTRSRTEGLLVHPHMEGWTAVGAARPCEPAAEVRA